jgi:dolichol-phosphate mannosyltransferase
MGYSSIIISIWFLSGIIIFVFGIIGLYVGKIFENVKDRPTYIIKEKL